MSDFPKVSIVIPTCNRLQPLQACLDCLEPSHQELRPDFFEIIVSDDAYTESNASWIQDKYPFIKYVSGPGHGPAANRNNGAKQARAAWIIFLDDDCLPERNIIQAYWSYFQENPEIQAWEGAIVPDRDRERMDEESPLNESGGAFWSCNIAVNTKLFRSIDGFDERFKYAAYEDMDLYHRICEIVSDVPFASNARVCHPWRRMRAFKKAMRQAKSMCVFLDKYPGELQKHRLIPATKIAIGSVLFEVLGNLPRFRGRGALAAFTYYSLIGLWGILYACYTLPRRIQMSN